MPKLGWTKPYFWDCTGMKALFINVSGGSQSSRLVLELARGEVITNVPVFAIFADPGMEKVRTYRYLDWLERELIKSKLSITLSRVTAGNLFNDLVSNTKSGRMDNPPYWVRKENNKRGKLSQRCTRYYKVKAIRQEMRRIIRTVIKYRKAWVECWTGFTADEQKRVTSFKQDVNFIWYRFPLYERGITKSDNAEWFRVRGLPEPPQSLCNGCFAHGLRSLKEMYDRRNEDSDWDQAVEVDESIRDFSRFGGKYPTYLSATLIPLQKLAEMDFKIPDKIDNDLHQCNAGMCFV